ncbi:MAG: MotA/TolQ/ExbB proton channel family protein [Acidobacteriota bacterium]
MRRQYRPALTLILTLCAFISITAFTIYINSRPEVVIKCLCRECVSGSSSCCNQTEDFSVLCLMHRYDLLSLWGYLILYVLSLYALAVIIERTLTYWAAGRQSREFKAKLDGALCGNHPEAVIALAACYPESPVAAIIAASFQEEGEIKPAMHARQRAIIRVTEDLKRGLCSLSIVGRMIPLVGLFIFFACLIITLQGMRYAEGTGISAIAGGLADALWPSVFCLLVAVPVICSHKYFASKLDCFALEIDRLSLAIIGQIESRRRRAFLSPVAKHYITRDLDARQTCRLAD